MEIRDNEIILRLEHIIQDEESLTRGVQLPSDARLSVSSMFGGVSARILIRNANRLISASGNQQLATAVRETAQWGFLGLRMAAGDPTALLVGLTKSVSMIMLEVQKMREERKQTAREYNELLQLQLRSGQASITANTSISYDKYNRATLIDRK